MAPRKKSMLLTRGRDAEEHTSSNDIDQAHLASETLTGDIRDWLLTKLRYTQDNRPWTERSETEQKTIIAGADSAARHLVREVVEIVAAAGRRTITATVESVVFKDGIKAVLTASRYDESRHHLADAAGATVLLIVADPEEFTGERAPVAITPDQSTMAADL